jgi:hypothetical protein
MWSRSLLMRLHDGGCGVAHGSIAGEPIWAIAYFVTGGYWHFHTTEYLVIFPSTIVVS